MTVTREEMYKTRLNIVRQMHEYIMNSGDEEMSEFWFRNCLPDNSCEEDFELYAEDAKEFRTLCEIFGHLTVTKKNFKIT